MTPELAKRLARVFPTAFAQNTAAAGVAGVASRLPAPDTGVADVTRYARKPLELRQLRPLRLESGNVGNMTNGAAAVHVAAPDTGVADAIEERAALAADSVPACYLDTWARLQCQRPLSIDLDAWQRVINDAGVFLDGWGADAAGIEWSADELFDFPHEGRPGGLVWQLRGERVGALGEDRARLTDGRTIKRRATGD
jgi:hypothetical protein